MDPSSDEFQAARASETARDTVRPRGTATSLLGASILVVDDDPDARELSSVILESAGARVYLASDANEALELFDAHDPEVVVSDLSLPGTDGHELLAKLRSRRASPLPSIAVSGWARPQDEARARESGFSSYLTKPVQPATLIAAVREALGAAARDRDPSPVGDPSGGAANATDAAFRDMLACLVPLVADGCVFDRFTSGSRACAAALHVDARLEALWHDEAKRPEPRTRVSVCAFGRGVGELLLWRSGPLGATEEALVCIAAERIGDAIETARLREALRVSDAERATLHALLAEELGAPLQALTIGLEVVRTRVRDSADEVPHAWLTDRLEILQSSVSRLTGLARRVMGAS